MFLRAGALSLALLLASRLLGVARESALAAAFGSSGLGDLAILALTLPDWIASVLAGGALAYVLLPAWAAKAPAEVAALQRRVAIVLVGAGAVLALIAAFLHEPLLRSLAAGVPDGLRPFGALALWWSAAAIPTALLAALWATRVQHERDFSGLYGANLVVNAVLIATIAAAASSGSTPAAVNILGSGLLASMLLRLAWLYRRQPAGVRGAQASAPMPRASAWLAAVLVAGLPLALPFVARSAASQAGEGALATFNYAWKLVELPLILAVQLVASIAFPAISRALASHSPDAARPVRQAFAVAWTLACGSIAALAFGAPALAKLLFGWGRMDAAALEQVWQWGLAGSWSLLPQALSAVALTVLATRGRLAAPVVSYGAALAGLLAAAGSGVFDGWLLMQVLNAGYALVAATCIAAMAREGVAWLPWRAIASSSLALAVTLGLQVALPPGWRASGVLLPLAAAAAAGAFVLLVALWRSRELREALRR